MDRLLSASKYHICRILFNDIPHVQSIRIIITILLHDIFSLLFNQTQSTFSVCCIQCYTVRNISLNECITMFVFTNQIFIFMAWKLQLLADLILRNWYEWDEKIRKQKCTCKAHHTALAASDVTWTTGKWHQCSAATGARSTGF